MSLKNWFDFLSLKIFQLQKIRVPEDFFDIGGITVESTVDTLILLDSASWFCFVFFVLQIFKIVC